MRLNSTLVIVCLILIGFQTQAQSCGTTIDKSQVEEINRIIDVYRTRTAIQSNPTVKYIEVKPHIVRKSDGSGGIVKSQIDSVFRMLNIRFAPLNIQFFNLEANFIDSDTYYEFDGSDETALAGTNDLNGIINVYYVNSITREGTSFNGYAYFPGSFDRIFMTFDATLNSISTLSHEFGHYFNLYHTHGKTNFGTTDELVDGSNCGSAGDDICDTAADPNQTDLVDYYCTYTGNATDANGDLYDPDPSNIMAYGRSKCRDHFTEGQYTRMENAKNATRNYLNGYEETSFASFIASEVLVENGGSVQFTDQSLDAVDWNWSFQGGTPSSSTDQNPLVTYSELGQHNVSLEITDSNGDVKSFEFPQYITVGSGVDITYNTPAGWDGPARFYKLDVDGITKIYQTVFDAGDNIFMDYGVINQGINDALDSTFRVNIYLNDKLIRWNTFTLSAGNTSIREERDLALPPPGANEIRIEYDVEDDYPEIDEDNNIYITNLEVSEPDVLPADPVSAVAGVEYFIDDIVGFGEGTFVTSTAENDVTLDFTVPMEGLTAGLHKLYTRALNQAGRWGQTSKRNFYVVPTQDVSLRKSEYFFDTDPGYGLANPIILTEGESNHTIDLTGISDGYHRLYVRSQNNMGRWSVTQNISFIKVGQKLDPKISKLVYRFYDYSTETYSEFVEVPIDPAVYQYEEILQLDNSTLVEGQNYAAVVYAQDENGTRSRIAFDNFVYNEILLINVEEIEITNVLCNGDATGIAAIPASGGSGTLQYSLDNITFQQDSIFNDLIAGDYTVYIKGDDADYVEERTFTIEEPDLLTLAISEILEPTCPDSENGSILLSSGGGTGSMTYSIDGETFVENPTFDNLIAGDYIFYVTDENGCIGEVSQTLESQYENLHPELVINGEKSTLAVLNDFESYQWYRNEILLSDETDTALYVDNHGSYFVVVENVAGCRFHSDTLSVNELLIHEVKTLGVSCEGGMDGAIRIFGSGGYGNDTYSINGQDFQTNQRFYGLSEGTHPIYVSSEMSGYVIEGEFEIGLAESMMEFEESFENRDPHKVLNPDDGISWVVSGSASFDGDFSLRLNFYNYIEPGEEDYYLLPNPVSTSDRMLLGFSYAYAKYSGDLSANDSLAVVQSFDCGNTWEVLAQRGGDELATAPAQESGFVPAEDQWVRRSVLIDTTTLDYLLAFKAINDFGNLLYLDSITLEIYPNNAPLLEEATAEVEENEDTGIFVAQLVAYDPDGDQLTFEILNGNIDDAFALNSETGEITVNNSLALDYEEIQQFELEVRVFDNYGGADTTLVTIDLIDIDDNEAPVIEDQTFSLTENSPSGTVVGTVIATDPEGSELTYSIIYGNIGGAFEIDENTGELTVANSAVLDYENITELNLGVEVIDVPGTSNVGNIRISLIDISDGVLSGSCRVSKYSDDFGFINFYYLDDQLVYVISDDDDSKIETSFEYADEKVIRASQYYTDDYGQNSSTFEIVYEGSRITQIFEYNEKYDDLRSSFFYENDRLVEVRTDYLNSSGNYSFYDGYKFVWDGDVIASEAYYLAPNQTTPYFTTTYEYDDKSNPFYEDVARLLSKNFYDFTKWLVPFNVISAQDDDGYAETYNYSYAENNFPISADVLVNETGYDYEYSIGFTYEFCDLQNYPPTISNQIFAIDENSEGGTSVGIISASDPNDDVLTFAILSGNTNNAFALSTTGELTVQNSSELDYETTQSFSLEVEVNDGNGGTAQATITVNLNDVDESSNTAPTIANQTFTIDENTANSTLVGQIVATDDDGDDLTFSILSGNTNNAFALSTTGELTVQNSSELDYETSQSFSLEVEVNDGNGGTAQATITVNLNDVDESSNTVPTITNQTFSVDENTANSTLVGQIVASDEDGDDLTFSILSGNTNNAFALSTTGELTVQNSSELDYETSQSFSLEVEVNDGNGGTAQATITVNLNDVDENTPPTIANQTFSIDENTANSTLVGQIVASDDDGDDLTFSITSGNTNNAFALATTGELTVQTSTELDFETTPMFSLEVEVSDGNGGTATSTITIELNNIDETTLIENTFQLPENSSAGTVIGAVGNFEIGTELFPYLEGSASQIDQNDEAQVKGLDLINSGALEFSSENFDLVLASDNALDFESFSSFKVIVKLCCFTAGSEPSTIITVDVLNVNESTTIEDQMFSIDENSLSGTLVGQVNAFDEDGDALNFSILSGNTNEAFALSTTGELSVQTPSELDFETTPTFNLEIEVNDGNGGAASASITINVNDVDETEPLSVGNDIADVQAYPNPNKGIVHVIFHDKYIGEEMVLIDFTGKEISRKILQNSEIEIDITDQAAGIYLMKIGNKIIKLTKAE